MKRMTALIVAYAAIVALLLFQPAAPRVVRAQSAGTPNPYIDALGTQAALNTQATLAALGSQATYTAGQSNTSGAEADLARAQAALADARARAAWLAQQATTQAGYQQGTLAAAQATSDASALQATAIVQQTRTAIELQATREAASVAAETTRQAIIVKSTHAAISADATRSAADAQRRDNESIATSVAVSIEATKTAIEADQRTTGARRDSEQRLLNAGTLAGQIGIALVGLIGALLLLKFGLGVWRSRALNPKPGPAAPLPMQPVASSASDVVVDAATGDIGSRFAVIEYDDDPQSLENVLRSIYGH